MESTSINIPSAGKCQNGSTKIYINSSGSLEVYFDGTMPDKRALKNRCINILITLEPAVKYESPYSNVPPVYDAQQTNLKRRASDVANDMRDHDGKRQRIEVPAANDDLDLASIIAQATATAERTFVESTLQGGQLSDSGSNGQGVLVEFDNTS